MKIKAILQSGEEVYVNFNPDSNLTEEELKNKWLKPAFNILENYL